MGCKKFKFACMESGIFSGQWKDLGMEFNKCVRENQIGAETRTYAVYNLQGSYSRRKQCFGEKEQLKTLLF
jgi:hypothetical protein